MRCGFAALLLVLAGTATAQSWGPRSLEELKQETIRRAERNMGPLAGIKAEDAREAMAGLHRLEPDEWAAARSRGGERQLRRGDEYQARQRSDAPPGPSQRPS